MDFRLTGSSFFFSSLMAGAAAGTAVDISLFPLDTIKTRLQSQKGFWAAGGFRRIYSGVGPTILGSAPTAAVFFCSYETTKALLQLKFSSDSLATPSTHHMFAATVGEVVACVIRVPVEIVKQRSQAGQRSSRQVFSNILRNEGLRGFYHGYASTVTREIPFSVIQFPLWEFLKAQVRLRRNGVVDPWQSAVCGSISGGIAAALTTPLDVAKTHIMLAEKSSGSVQATGNVAAVLRDVWRERGLKGIFAGISPRVTWISIGGFVFLGVYDKIKNTLNAKT